MQFAKSTILGSIIVFALIVATPCFGQSTTDTEQDPDFVERLENEIKDMKGRNLSKVERHSLAMLKQELKVAKSIVKQMDRLPLNTDDKKSNDRTGDDSFVLAKLEVPANSNVANITFEQATGLLENAEALTNYLKETPPGAYRDYRLVSRHTDETGATYGLEAVRKAYDEHKERERQMLEYIAARNRELARIQAARRC